VPDLDDLTDELYAVPPALFVDARTAVVAAARAAGDTATAARLAKLRKPTVTAWLANRLVRTEPDLVAGVLALGPALRDATVAGDREALRDLARHRQVLLRDLVGAARSLAQDAGQTFTATTQREVESTFTAAAALATARLAAPLSSVGLGFELGAVPPDRPAADAPGSRRTEDTEPSVTETPGASTVASAVTPAAPARSAREEAHTAAREQAVTDAELALAAARLQDADATAALADAQAVLDAAAEAEKRAAAEHQAARAALSDARADLTAAKADATSTHRAVASALGRLERARTR